MLSQRPTQQNQRHSQPEYTTMYGGLWGDKEEEKEKKDWQQMLAQVPILKKKKERGLFEGEE